VLRAFADVELALTAEETLAREAVALERAAVQSVAAQSLAENRYGAGLDDFLTVLQAQRDANAAQTALLAVQRLRLDARVDLYLALGGGFDATASNDEPTATETTTP
jgi:outer membrane protein TolC